MNEITLTNCRFELLNENQIKNFDKVKTKFMKTPLLLLGICTSLFAGAQTIELADTISTGNSMTYYVLDSNATAYADITGAAVTWDYSAVGAYGMAPNVNNVIDRADSDFASDFPSAAYAESFENSVNTFFSNNAAGNEVIVHGFVFQELANDFIIKYDSDQLISYKFPMNLGDTYTDPIAGTATVPLAGDIVIDGEATITADGTGTLKVGDVTYTNVIRVHTTEVSEGIILGSPAVITRESYVYYDIDNFNMPIFIHATVLAELGLGGDFGFTAVYSKDEITDYVGIATTKSPEVNFSVYPNPSTVDFVTVSTPEGTESIAVMNAIGEIVYKVNKPTTYETINVSNLANGVYFVQTTNAGATKTLKLIVK